MIAALAGWRAEAPDADYEYVGDLVWGLRALPEPARNVRLWEAADGRLIGFARVTPGGSALWQAAPTADLAEEQLAWCLGRLRALGAAPASARARASGSTGIAFLEAHGFVRQEGHQVEYRRQLDGVLPPVELPPGYRIEGFGGEVDDYVAMHCDAWSTWGPSTYDAAAHRQLMASPLYDPALNPVVWAPDGTMAAYCIGWLDGLNRLGEIEPLGTRPAYRRLGLARAVVAELLRRFRAAGAERAVVFTAPVNPSAMALYESLGFGLADRVLYFSRDL